MFTIRFDKSSMLILLGHSIVKKSMRYCVYMSLKEKKNSNVLGTTN